jgi:hypothetical protein
VPGFHRTADLEMRTDPDLYLIHLHRMDYDICLERHRYRQNRAWNERDLDQGWARHNRITDEAAFARWFYEDTNSPFERLLVERMDPAWRGVL